MRNVFLKGAEGVGWSLDADFMNTKWFLESLGIRISRTPLFANAVHAVSWSSIIKPQLPRLFKGPVIAVASNELDFGSEAFKKARGKIDLWIVPSQREVRRFKEKGLNVRYQPFYVPEKIFKQRKISRSEICETLGLDHSKLMDKFLIGSFQRDTLGSDLAAPKWQKDPDLMLEVLRRLPVPRDRFILILAGPRRHYVIRKCEEYGLPYHFVGKMPRPGEDDIGFNILPQEKCALLYGLVDCYLVSSKSEGGPKAVIEAAFSKTPILTTDVGLARDFCSPESIYSEVDEAVGRLLDLLKMPDPRNWGAVSENFRRASDLGLESSFLERYREIYGHLGFLA